MFFPQIVQNIMRLKKKGIAGHKTRATGQRALLIKSSCSTVSPVLFKISVSTSPAGMCRVNIFGMRRVFFFFFHMLIHKDNIICLKHKLPFPGPYNPSEKHYKIEGKKMIRITWAQKTHKIGAKVKPHTGEMTPSKTTLMHFNLII